MNDSLEKKHIEMLRPYLGECCVLLKKDGSFPLDSPCFIAAYGHGVRHTIKGGTGSGEVNSRYFVNIEQGLEEAGFTLVHKSWHEDFEKALEQAKAEFTKFLKAKAKEEKTNVLVAAMGAVMKQPEYDLALDYTAEAAIYVVSRISGEGNDRNNIKGDFKLTDSEIRDILKLNKNYEKFMLVINAGGPLDLTPVKDVSNILVLSQLGVETGHVLSDIFLGKTNPSGRLTTTWSAYEDYGFTDDFGNWDDTRYREGIYVGYRYFDSIDKKPLYPFGYGLSYTEFRSSFKDIKTEGSKVSVKITVKNIGKYPGKETIQLYLSCPVHKLDKEVKSLVAYKKTKILEPNRSQTLELSFDLKDFSSYDGDKASYILEKGKYVLLLGKNASDTLPIAILNLKKNFTVRKVKNLFPETDFSDYQNHRSLEYDKKDLTEIDLDLSKEKTEIITYEQNEHFDERLKHLSDSQLALLNIGAYKGFMANVIGSASTTVAGAAGESYGEIKEVQKLIMADGPAGLRLSRYFYEDSKGIHSLGSNIPETILEVLPKIIKWFLKHQDKQPKNIEIKEQFATALPIETAIAQSFNDEFAYICGYIVGEEMEAYGVDLWLAPAMNIHRNVLCGRNFEYFSEDPILTAHMASAITKGVQKHEGRGVTIKHFAANNQERNRYASNSIVSERALREIYLKAFGLCIKEADPAAVMSSYNLLNGTHTSESRVLSENILRDEFDFKGLLMTDWITGGLLLNASPKYAPPNAGKVAAAGNSLFMPGSKRDYKQIMRGLKNNTVTREQLMINASHLLKVIDNLKK
ncbi:MAG: glycoside hydrolase family 3 C-terminal domain-containing protein [Erysipelotrichaceae bacterium]|nr:glycoside hydrolase family 3 C-terminal domain-containing protein [Erysipelotrichaceae bacterium]